MNRESVPDPSGQLPGADHSPPTLSSDRLGSRWASPASADGAAARSSDALVVEEAGPWLEAIVATLEQDRLAVDVAHTALEGIRLFEASMPAVVVLDLGLRGRAGIDVWRHIRARSGVPIIMFAEGPGSSGTVISVDTGQGVASSLELHRLAHDIRSGLGEALTLQLPERGVIEVGHIRLDRDRHQVYVQGTEVPFPKKEYMLLDLLLTNAGLPLTNEELIERVWADRYTDDPKSRKTLQVHMKRIRDRIGTDPSHRSMITNIRGIGYRFRYPDPPDDPATKGPRRTTPERHLGGNGAAASLPS